MEQTLLLLQLSDSAFPTGGFTHSLGLESSVQHKQVQHTDFQTSKFCSVLSTGELKSFITCLLENAGSFSIPFVQEAYRGCADAEELRRLDHLCHICTANHIACRASSRQGKAMADVVNKVFGCDDLRHLSSTSLMNCHYAVVFGGVCGTLGLSLDTTLASYMSGVIRTSVASAVRLDKLGPVEAQRILTELQRLIPDVISRNKSRSTEDACITFPVIDILQNCHDALFCKLFCS